jgi:hypothetical protein
VLIPPGTPLEVISAAEDAGGLYIIQLLEVACRDPMVDFPPPEAVRLQQLAQQAAAVTAAVTLERENQQQHLRLVAERHRLDKAAALASLSNEHRLDKAAALASLSNEHRLDKAAAIQATERRVAERYKVPSSSSSSSSSPSEQRVAQRSKVPSFSSSSSAAGGFLGWFHKKKVCFQHEINNIIFKVMCML